MTKICVQDRIRTTQPAEVRSINKIRLTLLGTSYEKEQKIGKTATVCAGGGLTGTFLIEYSFYTRDGQDTKTYFDITPNVYVGIRKYYNFSQRIKKGKKRITIQPTISVLMQLLILSPYKKNCYQQQGTGHNTPMGLSKKCWQES